MVFQENEIISFLLCIGVFGFVLSNRTRITQLPSAPLFLAAFYLFFASEILTVVEGFWATGAPLNTFFNTLEHIGYAASSVLIAVWAWRAFHPREAPP